MKQRNSSKVTELLSGKAKLGTQMPGHWALYLHLIVLKRGVEILNQ